MRIVVNGEARDLAEDASVADALAAAGVRAEQRVAVARNGAIVPRAAWAGTALAEGDRLEVVAPIQGGAR